MTLSPTPVVTGRDPTGVGAVRIGSLCSGYGGLELGVQAVIGGTVAWHCENDPHPAKVLAARYPDVPNHGDITTTDWTQVEPVDWLTAGYPCQPFSGNGLRLGDQDERHLWPHVAHAVGILRPARILLENVDGHRSLGLDRVLWDLAAMGYVGRWGVVRASDAGAPHRRDRVFIVARNTDSMAGLSPSAPEGRPAPLAEPGAIKRTERPDRTPVADTDRDGLASIARLSPGRDAVYSDGWRDADGPGTGVNWGALAPAIARWEAILGRPAPRPAELAGTDWRLSPLFVEWVMGLAAGWVTDVPNLSDEALLKMLGNGVVPQQAAFAVRTLLSLGSVAA